MKKTLYFSDTKSFKRHIDIYGISNTKPYVVEGNDVLTVEVYNSRYKYPTTTLRNLYRELQAYRQKLLDANGTHSTVVKNFNVLIETMRGILIDSHEGTADITSLYFNYKVTRHSDGTHDITLMCWDFTIAPTDPTNEPTETEPTDKPTDEPTEPTLTQQFVDWINCKVETDTWKMGNVHLCRITFDNPERNCINIWVNKTRIAKIDYHFNIIITDDSYKQGALDVFNIIKNWYNEYLEEVTENEVETESETETPTENETESKQEENTNNDNINQFVPLGYNSYVDVKQDTPQSKVIYANKNSVLYGYHITFNSPTTPQLSRDFINWIFNTYYGGKCTLVFKKHLMINVEMQDDEVYNSIAVLDDKSQKMLAVFDYNLVPYFEYIEYYDKLLETLEVRQKLLDLYSKYLDCLNN